MVEKWKKVKEAEDVYNVVDTVVVRTVRKSELLARKEALLNQIKQINKDLKKIEELERGGQ